MNCGSTRTMPCRIGHDVEALGYFHRALTLFETINDEDDITRSLANAGAALCRIGRVQEAREYFSRALDKVRGARERLVADPVRIACMKKWHVLLFLVVKVALDERRPGIIPDGPLHLLAFGSLIREPRADSVSRRYLVEWKPLHFALSVTVFA